MNTKNILKLAIPLFIIHAIEEYSEGLTRVDSFFQWASHVTKLPIDTIYISEQVLLIALIVWAIYTQKRWLLSIIGIIFAFELTHLTRAISPLNYYPGLITALPLLAMGVLFWRELIKNYTNKGRKLLIN